MSWLKFNNVTLTNGSVLVVITDGTSTAGIEPGYALIAHGLVYEIAGSNTTTITLSNAYLGTTENNVQAKVQPTHSPIVNLLNSAIQAMQNYAGTPTTPTEPTPDTTAPVINTPNNLVVQFANGGAGVAHSVSALQAWLNSASAVDNVDSSVTVNHNLAALPDPLTAAIHTITFTATDSAGNTGTGTAAVSISEAGVADTTNPIVAAPNNITLEFANAGAGLAHSDSALQAWLDSASAVDNVDSSVTVNHNLATLPDPLTAAIHTITFTATDIAGNTGTNTATLTVSEAVSTTVYGEDIIIPVQVL